MRIGWVSPLPPQQTGIADYSAELLPYLAPLAAVEAFTAPAAVAPAAARLGLEVRPYRELARRAAALDAVVYHLGNSAPFHQAIWRLLQEVPGVVVLHEYLCHHLVREITLVRGDVEGYVEELRYAYGDTGVAVARRFLDGGVPVDPWSFPLFERAVDQATTVVTHNRTTRERVLASRPTAAVTVIPHLFDPRLLPAGLDRAAARRTLGLPEEAPLLGTFGHVTPAKRMDVTLHAFARLRQEQPAARLLVVGEVSPHYDLDALLGQGLRQGVELIGRTELDQLFRYMAAVDVAVNLRHPSGGETSGTFMRLLGMGQAVVVSDVGSFAETPDGCCAKVPVDAFEEETLLATLSLLVARPDLRRAMGESARRHMHARHRPQDAAAAYLAVCRRAAAEGRREPLRPVPPLAPFPPSDVATRLVQAASAALADLGVGEGDDEVPRALAETLVDLDLDGGWRREGER
ncbi:MAG TPA: glycosyltransferase family 4 protein [Thermoanaerobaculia bacterium]|nr:glycosyltransferase family 4 protein [Thermoanaerobaculia bacterium]